MRPTGSVSMRVLKERGETHPTVQYAVSADAQGAGELTGVNSVIDAAVERLWREHIWPLNTVAGMHGMDQGLGHTNHDTRRIASLFPNHTYDVGDKVDRTFTQGAYAPDDTGALYVEVVHMHPVVWPSMHGDTSFDIDDFGNNLLTVPLAQRHSVDDLLKAMHWKRLDGDAMPTVPEPHKSMLRGALDAPVYGIVHVQE